MSQLPSFSHVPSGKGIEPPMKVHGNVRNNRNEKLLKVGGFFIALLCIRNPFYICIHRIENRGSPGTL